MGVLSDKQFWGNGLFALGGALSALGAAPEQRAQVANQQLALLQQLMGGQRAQKEKDFELNLRMEDRARELERQRVSDDIQRKQVEAQNIAIGGLPENLQNAARVDNSLIGKYYEGQMPQRGGKVEWKTIREGDKDVTYQINADGTFKKIAEGAAWSPNVQQAQAQPSSILEWQAFSAMSPEDRQAYLGMKRGPDWQNAGGALILPNQINPAGAPIATINKTLAPQDTPEVKGAQAAATELARANVEASVLQNKNSSNAANTLNLLDGVENLIDKSTGSIAGAGRDALAAAFGNTTEGAAAAASLKVIQAKLMLSMPRMEGPQSDRDVNLYREAAGQLGDPTVPAGVKKAAVETIRDLQSKYTQPQTITPTQPAPASNDPLGIRK